MYDNFINYKKIWLILYSRQHFTNFLVKKTPFRPVRPQPSYIRDTYGLTGLNASFFTRNFINYKRQREISQIFDSRIPPQTFIALQQQNLPADHLCRILFRDSPYNRTTPRCANRHFLKNNRLVKSSQASYLPLHFVNFHFHISQC